MIDPPARRGPGPRPPVRTTGRQVVVFADRDDVRVDWSAAGVTDVADSRDFPAERVPAQTLREAGATVFARLGIAVVAAGPDQVGALRAAAPPVLSVSPELVHRVLPEDLTGYVRGYRDGVADLAGRVLGAGGGDGAAAPPLFQDTAAATWGVQAVRATTSPWTGSGIRVAVLDTGLDLAHPDFAGRAVTAESFVPGEAAQDGHGHGTHCVGTACGPQSPPTGPRYGVASGAEVFVGKVLGDEGSGDDGGILAGIDWAVANGCAVISMSLGADVAEAHPPYSAAGRRALQQGSLIVAAAGNNADRENGELGFVGAPANSVEILAVGALDPALTVAWFSARSLSAPGGEVDVAAPGVDVLSTWPMPDRYHTISGTSMATPHVAGVAALWAEATGRRGYELWATLTQAAQRLTEPSVDVGSGLVLAPQEGAGGG
ncbi:subtilase family protein [Geodermatophilus tzadiensis]|uniref:Subtilase family protein n=1 Tax=Geodermatophilus tzadiensis TaxID=1137988 RepID=A0A2T0TZ49_9ACTN|nr:S8 family serine peptidase [Geodermatophilus tzadiensis]PRY50951.1 subtilase family protein [Geodermatophilus tzadiensis]